MATNKLELGPSGHRVRENIRRLRGSMQYKELSERLEAVGSPIPPLGLRRIEAGERRVSVDDLVALSVVFEVSPLTLLLPSDGSRYTASAITGLTDREVAHNTQWLWGRAEQPLELPNLGRGAAAEERIALFRARSVPQIDERTAMSGSASFVRPGEADDQLNMRLMAENDQLFRNQGLMPRGDD